MAKSLKEQLARIGLKKVKMHDGKTLAETMAEEARRLYRCIQHYIDEYYNSYEPVVYERTDRYQGALYAQNIADIRVVGDTLRIGVVFHNALAMHPNLESVVWDYGYFYDYEEFVEIPIMHQHDSFVPLLMEKGWHARKLENILGQRVYRLTYFEGIHAVEKGIADFNKTNKLGIKIDADDFYNGIAY